MKYLMDICEKVSMSFWTLLVGILRSNRFFGGGFVYGASYTCRNDSWG